MAVTPYQINNVLNAYTRQSKIKISSSLSKENAAGKQFRDIVSLSVKDARKEEEIEKISYNLRDVLLKGEDG
ncbi:MAG TPA: hypothetical protein PKN70_05110 [Smithellaceae bacterium]|jgi:hypothetical protein|nr:hypothetical protein [Smithellaceae bacterium]